jgi:DNA gyrase subunit A
VDANEGKVIPVAIEDEVKESYLNYAMSVIVSRALPDVRDGLKPVHRRILFAMNEMGLRSERPYKKTARLVGDILGKYHPHGDQSIYDALVRLAQDFSVRYPVVDGQGNFGSIDGDPPAAMRYTEARMGNLAEEMLKDIKKETVDFGPNYDDSLTEPVVLPAGIPFLLINGGSGIAVGMATNMAPHNIKESVDAIVACIENAKIRIDELMKYIKGPDFPTGGIILGKEGIRETYKTGRGRIILRARLTLETNTQGRETIIITELPYQVNKANLIVHIADLVKERKIEGITDLRDESDRHGIRIVIELKRGITPRVIINQLFTNTNCQIAFCSNNVALVDGAPKIVRLKEIITAYINHRKEVVKRRTQFDLKKAEERAHILEGLKKALQNIDEVITIIKGSTDVDTARKQLMKKLKLTEVQAQAILDMRLQKLTSLEKRKIIDELKELKALIITLKDLLSSEQKILGVVKDELLEIAQKYGDERRTEIRMEEAEELDIEDLIIKEDMVILLSHQGFIRRVTLSAYRRQGRGGRGATSASRDTDFIEQLFIASTHDYVLFVTNEGKAYWLRVHEIPEGSRTSRGYNIRTILSISNDEDITAVVSLNDFSSNKTFFMATCRGVVKKVNINLFSHAKTHGIIALNLDPQDKLIAAKLTTGDDEIMLITRKGKALRFHEEAVRAMGRSSRGVRGIKLSKGDEVVGILTVTEIEEMFIVSEFGYGKRIKYDNFSSHGRGTRGQICCKITEKNGEIAGVLSVKKQDDIVCITSKGNTLKVRVKEIPIMGKNAVGVKVVNIEKPDIVVGVARAEKE